MTFQLPIRVANHFRSGHAHAAVTITALEITA